MLELLMLTDASMTTETRSHDVQVTPRLIIVSVSPLTDQQCTEYVDRWNVGWYGAGQLPVVAYADPDPAPYQDPVKAIELEVRPPNNTHPARDGLWTPELAYGRAPRQLQSTYG